MEYTDVIVAQTAVKINSIYKYSWKIVKTHTEITENNNAVLSIWHNLEQETVLTGRKFLKKRKLPHLFLQQMRKIF